MVRVSQYRMTRLGGAVALLLLGISGAQAQSRSLASAPPGATACIGCHGVSGTALPGLDSLSPAAISEAMQGFRDGTREATLMNRIAKGFTPEESKAIADWLGTPAGKSP